jgi:hypothetical protein
VDIAIKVGSIRLDLMFTKEARRLKLFLIFSMVFSWFAITLRML